MKIFLVLMAVASLCGTSLAQETGTPPKVGDMAKDFTLESADKQHEEVTLSKELKNGPVVLLVLRGYPGYQCPLCSRQVGQYVSQANKFARAGATVLMVYPGPSEDLQQRAIEFMKNADVLPENFKLLLDPDYKFTNEWHLRWAAPRETAYPSTFVIGEDDIIKFAKVSEGHGGRSRPVEVLKILQ